MLHSIRLQNFKCHADLNVQFGPGLQVIRGAVEHGKSSLIDAIMYGWYGLRALPQTLENTVTWGVPENQLRVDMEFSHAGQTYKLYRSKSGAELTTEGLRVSGHSEVTKYIQTLFGATADVASMLQVVRQKDLESVFEDKGLISKLANFDVLDSLIEKIQQQLPSGNTKMLDTMLATDLAQVQPSPIDTAHLDAEIDRFQRKIEVLDNEQKLLTQQLVDLDEDTANKTLGKIEGLKVQKEELDKLIQTLERDLEVAQQTKIEGSKIEALQAGAAKQALQRRMNVAYTYFLSVKGEGIGWEGTLGELRTFQLVSSQLTESMQRRLNDLRIEEAKLQVQRVTDASCGFCGKDLTAVPEVQSRNKEINEKLAELKVEISETQAKLTQGFNDSRESLKILRSHELWTEKLYEPYKEFLQVDLKAPPSVPAAWQWAGPKMDDTLLDMQNYDALIAAENARLRVQERALRTLSEAEGRLRSSQDSAANLALEIDRLVALDAASVVAKAKAVQEELRQMNMARTKYLAEISHQVSMRSKIEYENEQAIRAWAQTQARIVDLQKQLELTKLNNRVIARVREAKPEITRRLWSNVLHAVSYHFSQIRGVASVVSRDMNGFLVDKKPIEGVLSGSTMDSLAVAMRSKLLRTFLPHVDCLILDEPCSSMNIERENSMLGTLITGEFPQVLMVTHSDLADSFAANIIEI